MPLWKPPDLVPYLEVILEPGRGLIKYPVPV